MKQKIIEMSKCHLLIVDLPDGAKRIYINENKRISFMTPTSLHFIEMKEKLPPGNWQLLGKLEKIYEEDARLIVENFEFKAWYENIPKALLRYRNYVEENKYNASFDNALQSLHSLIESEISLTNLLGEKPMKTDNYQKDGGEKQYSIDLKKWQEAEKIVYKNPFLIIDYKL